ncbi:MAG TPA: adenine deaminase [Acidimicrobiales bacterium]|nr:adenine deaminase [Acidimicrobiales bacterium]
MARPGVSADALAAARGDRPADLLLVGGRVFSPGSLEWIDTNLAIADGHVVGWGDREAEETLDVDGAALVPAFIDAHMHLESTKLWIDEFVRAVLPHGTTAVAADPHELGNVFGTRALAVLAAAAEELPFTFGMCASSCVPASPFESSGAEMGVGDVVTVLEELGGIGVAEVMNYPGVIAGDAELMEKIAAAGSRRVDGHAPGLTGTGLDAYLAAGVESDHECSQLAEAVEKRRKGMWVFLREGSASRDLLTLLPMVLSNGPGLTAFCTDDREPNKIRRDGHINDCVRMAVAAGLDERQALVMATANPASYHGFHHLGALGPGYQADVLVFDELATWRPTLVFQRGRMVARNGEVVPGAVPSVAHPSWMTRSIQFAAIPTAADLMVEPPPGGRCRVIGVKPGSLLTDHLVCDVTDPASDINRLAVVERHHSTGRVGAGWVANMGIGRGAIASTVAHDAHNCVVVGGRGDADARDMVLAVRRIAEIGGGQVVVAGGKVLAEVPLPIGGLISDRPRDEVSDQLELANAAARSLGTTLRAPFMTMSFLALSVIPSLRLSDQGLVDVDKFELTEVCLP